jgi:hypothetical protein
MLCRLMSVRQRMRAKQKRKEWTLMLENVRELDILHRNTTLDYGAYLVHREEGDRIIT